MQKIILLTLRILFLTQNSCFSTLELQKIQIPKGQDHQHPRFYMITGWMRKCGNIFKIMTTTQQIRGRNYSLEINLNDSPTRLQCSDRRVY